MKSSKLFITSLLAAAAMGTSAYATSLSDATLAIESFTTENITALGTAGWNVSGITISGTDGTFTTTETTGTPLSSITAAGSSNTLSTNVSTGSATARYTFSTIVTVDASLFSGTDNGNIIAGSTISNGSVSTSSAIGVGFSSGNIIGTWGGNGYNTQTSLDVSNSIVNGKVTIGLVFAGETGANLYLADGSTINLSGLKSSSNYEAIILSNKAVTYSNLYWFNTALSPDDMQIAVVNAASTGARQAALTWAGGTFGTWDYESDANWTMSGESGTVSTAFQNWDGVTFATDGAQVELTQSSGSYWLKGLTVSAATSLTGTGTVAVVAANLTTTAALTLDENVVLNLGSSESVVNKNILGSGTVKFVNSSTGYGATLTLGSGFSGTIEYSGKFNTSNGTNNSNAKFALSNGRMWGGNTIANDIHFLTDYQLGDTTATTIVLNGNLTQANETTLTIGTHADTNVTFGGAGTVISDLRISAGKLTMNAGQATIKGSQSLVGNLEINNGATVYVGETDSLKYGATNTITVNAGGVLDFGSNRWTIGANNGFVLAGGTIQGAGQPTNGAMDFYRSATVEATAGTTSEISAAVRIRNEETGGTKVTFSVDDGAKLTLSGMINGAGALKKTGTGELVVSGTNTYTGGTTIEGGVLTAQSATALGSGPIENAGTLELAAATGTVSNVISGAGAIKKTGTGTVTLAGTNTSYSGQTTIEGGVLVAGNASALGAGNVVVADGATLARGLSSGPVEVGGTLTTNGAAILSTGALNADTAAFAVTGAVTLSAGTIFDVGSLVDGGKLVSSAGTLTIADSGTLTKGNFLLNGSALGSRTTFDISTSGNAVTISNVQQNALTLTWFKFDDAVWSNGCSGWSYQESGISGSSFTETFQSGDSVIFSDDTPVVKNVVVDGVVSVGTMTIDSEADFAFSGQNGAAITSSGALTKSGTGTATIDSSVDLSRIGGGIVVEENGGKLVVDTASGYAGAVTAGANGTFTLNVSSDTTLANTLSSFAGTFEKTGAGTLTVSTANTGLTGQFVISEGTVKLGATGNVFGATGREAALVNEGGTLDVNGKGVFYKFVLAGGLLVNNGTDIAKGAQQLDGLRLSADSSVGGTGTFGLISSQWGSNVLDLAGFTLTKTGSNEFLLASTTVKAGTIDVRQGTLTVMNGNDAGELFSMDPGALIKLNGGTLKATVPTGSLTSVKLGDVAVVLTATNKDKARITADSSCTFNAGGATLYLDIGALTDTVLTGEEVALTIAAGNAIDSFFSEVQVGTYDEYNVWQTSSEWKYLENSWLASNGTLSITAIPEPSVFGLLAGLGALSLAGTRRRRKKA